ncbi:MAG: hypothetical protein ACRDN0_15790 [Trebonia sp.]
MIVEHALLGWRDVPAGQVLADATGLTVRVDNHAHAPRRPARALPVRAPGLPPGRRVQS